MVPSKIPASSVPNFHGILSNPLISPSVQQAYFVPTNQQMMISQPNQNTWEMPIKFTVSQNINYFS